jgi:hypothetical protein
MDVPEMDAFTGPMEKEAVDEAMGNDGVPPPGGNVVLALVEPTPREAATSRRSRCRFGASQ